MIMFVVTVNVDVIERAQRLTSLQAANNQVSATRNLTLHISATFSHISTFDFPQIHVKRQTIRVRFPVAQDIFLVLSFSADTGDRAYCINE